MRKIWIIGKAKSIEKHANFFDNFRDSKAYEFTVTQM